MNRSRVLAALLRPIDVLVGMPAFVSITLLACFPRRIASGRTLPAVVARFPEGATVASLYRKFGNLDNFFLQHVIPGATAKVICIILESPHFVRAWLRPDYFVFEGGASRFFPCWSWGIGILRAYRLGRQQLVTLAHANSPYRVGLSAWVLSRMWNVPLVVSFHSDYLLRDHLTNRAVPKILGSKKISHALARFVLDRADRVLPIRQSMLAGDLAFYKVDHSKIRIFPHGLDTARLPSLDTQRPPYLEGKRIVSIVGRVEKVNYADHWTAVAKAVLSNPGMEDVLFVAAGDGKELAFLRSQCESTPLLKRHFQFLGPLPSDEAFILRLHSHVSLCLRAGFSLLEAMWARSPVVCYDVEWHSEVVKNGEQGFLIPELDVEGAARAVTRLLNNATEAKTMGLAGHQMIAEKYMLDKSHAIKKSVYAEVLASF